MSDPIPPRSPVDQNMASEQDDRVFRDLWPNESDYFGTSWLTELTADQYSDRFDARNERWESDASLKDLGPKYTASPLGGAYDLDGNDSSESLLNAGPASMDAGFRTVDVPDQQTVDPRWTETGNWDSTGVSSQQLLGDTGLYPTEPLNGASSTPYDDSGATGSTGDEGAPVGMDPNTVSLECYGVETFRGPMRLWANSNKPMFERDKGFRCIICEKPFKKRWDNLKGRHLLATKECEAAWGCLGKLHRGKSCTCFETGIPCIVGLVIVWMQNRELLE